jgi:hypothetical protein
MTSQSGQPASPMRLALFWRQLQSKWIVRLIAFLFGVKHKFMREFLSLNGRRSSFIGEVVFKKVPPFVRGFLFGLPIAHFIPKYIAETAGTSELK